ncbi:M50 family metallopeptidase [Sulfitobacter sp. HNIBRBA3233]|uniref:M50 family metallopeptidase n=1 Tax=Sulfitobacter marinivivus TaxID=3158558 RepID=UPI0032DE8B03
MRALRYHLPLFAILAVIFALWQTPAVLPVKVLIVFLHELSHAIAAWLTGGSVLEISVNPAEGGFTVTRGGNAVAILTAGYLGSLLIGVGLLVVALRSDADRLVLGIFGAVTLFVTLFYVREPFAALFCGASGLVLLAIAVFAGHRSSDLVLRIIGLSSVIYVPYDIFDDTIARSALPSDARVLSETFGGPTVVWGGLWLALSLAVIAWSLRHALAVPSTVRTYRPR